MEILREDSIDPCWIYRNCWIDLKDLRQRLITSGLNGLAILFDVFDDIISNLNNIK